jgi:hypothetical protein
MSDKSKSQPFLYDTRVLQRNVGEGSLSQSDVQAHLEALPDVSAKAEPFLTSLNLRDDGDDDLGNDE